MGWMWSFGFSNKCWETHYYSIGVSFAGYLGIMGHEEWPLISRDSYWLQSSYVEDHVDPRNKFWSRPNKPFSQHWFPLPECCRYYRFFYGDKQRGKCGAGMVIQMGRNHFFCLCMSTRKGSNNQAKLLALWGLLYFSKAHGIVLQQILGDSMVIIDWAMRRNNLQSLVLSHWIDKVIFLLDSDPHLVCHHIYREYNTHLDAL